MSSSIKIWVMKYGLRPYTYDALIDDVKSLGCDISCSMAGDNYARVFSKEIRVPKNVKDIVTELLSEQGCEIKYI